MQNNQLQYPPHLMQQPHLQRLFHPQVAYPTMANLPPSTQTQGVFSTYPARLKHSDDNALLLPESYVTKKTRFTGKESEDEFDEFMEESDKESSDSEQQDENAMEEDKNKGKETSESKVNAATLAAAAVAPPPIVSWPKAVRKKSNITYTWFELSNISTIDEVLVPVRLDLDIDSVKLRDRFLWNMNEQYLTPEKFADMLCQDLELSPFRFVQPIADSIRSQVLDFESFSQVELPSKYKRVIINLDLQIGKVNYRDQFEWELENDKTNAPEVFSRQLASELGVGGEYIAIISHAIREQLFNHKKHYIDELSIDAEIQDRLDSGYRPIEEAKRWVPHMDMLSNEALEKLLISQERNIRRMRRETRFKRANRRR